MEQSYKLAAQYLGTGGGQQAVIVDEPEKERKVMPVNQVNRNVVSSLSASADNTRSFSTAVGTKRTNFKNTISACVASDQSITYNGGVIVNPGQWLLNAVGQLVQPIFNRGQLRANYKIAEAERKIALLNFNQLLIDAGKEVNNALNDISSARDRLGYVREQTGLLEDAVVKTELLMRHSPTNYLEVLTAQQSLLAAQQLEVQCRYDEIAGIITLYHALGGGR